MRKSLEINEEELKQRHNYTCMGTHLGLDNKLDMFSTNFDYDLEPPIVALVSSVLAVILVCLSAMTKAIIKCKRKHAGPHSLFAFATYIIGETKFPEFSVVLMLDDVQVGYYDRANIHQKPQNTDDYGGEQQDITTVFEDIYKSITNRASELGRHFNLTHVSFLGIHVHQRLAGCELSDSESPGQIKSWDAFDGLTIVKLGFSMQQNGFDSGSDLNRLGWDFQKLSLVKRLYAQIYYPICIKTLKKYLHIEKNNVMRKVKPRVRLLKKTLTDSGMVQVTCLATGFYPRHINLTILRDGQPVPEDLVTGGMLLPNDDGTYQMRKSLEVNAEELRMRHYTCSATHLSLDNKLDISLEYDLGPPLEVIVSSVLAVILLCVIAIVVAIIMCRRKHAGSQSSLQSKYTAASSTEEQETSADATS
ncbi:HLA class I histocompatibility antigen, Cw-3 alpha chain-like [Chanos chanos]|uniref:HLA class I histocompatibility antigen, Cw-3 alpha chain-like n=1 Tax=Chanos chanos TaxID=29144 RepID=A0A6J2UMS2_CHACN|nr:HLA class I histocompatibility antigen, Cw-3 alpha chain-like [Chanos chanos]